jgi:hypothetical protein
MRSWDSIEVKLVGTGSAGEWIKFTPRLIQHVAKPMSAETLKELLALLDPSAGGFAIEHRHAT